MTDGVRFILIGVLLQGALGREWAVWMPQRIEALSGSCVLIPCRFEIPSLFNKYLVAGARGKLRKHGTQGRIVFDSSKTESMRAQNEIKGRLIGKLLMKNCTTILDNFPSSYRDTYFFRLESQSPLNFNFGAGVQITPQDSPPKPKLTPEKVEVVERTSVSLSCSAAAPCPKLPPNVTWTPRLGDIVDQLQENEDNTTSVSSVLTFTASHLQHGQKITCRALYTLQQGDKQKTSEASRILRVLYKPQISGSCSRTAAEISCSCESRGNPSPSMEWRVSGLRVTNSTDSVIREEQLGNTGLRSSLTMRHSQGDTPTLLCLSTNTLGSSSFQPDDPSPPQHPGFNITALLISVAAVAGALTMTCLVMKAKQKKGWAIPFQQGRKKRDNQCPESRRKDTEVQTLCFTVTSPPPVEGDPVYANHAMAATQSRDPKLGGPDPQPLAEARSRAGLESMQYASIKHSLPPVETQSQDAREGAASRQPDVVYSQVALKKEMEANPECEYSNFVFKENNTQH